MNAVQFNEATIHDFMNTYEINLFKNNFCHIEESVELFKVLNVDKKPLKLI